MVKAILILVLFLITYYILYINGFLILNSKRAIMFVGSARGKKATFTSCTGYTKRVVKFQESKKYRFELNAVLSKGDVQVELSEYGGKEVLQLNSQVQSCEVFLEKGRRYYLTVRFQSASGKYELIWEAKDEE